MLKMNFKYYKWQAKIIFLSRKKSLTYNSAFKIKLLSKNYTCVLETRKEICRRNIKSLNMVIYQNIKVNFSFKYSRF